MVDWRDLVKQRKFAEAEALMLAETEHQTGYGDEILTRASFYEDWGDFAGDKTAAKEYYEKSLDGFQFYASCATSGGEGLARMIDVNRLREKLEGLQ